MHAAVHALLVVKRYKRRHDVAAVRRGRLVNHCITYGRTLETLELEEYKKMSDIFGQDVYDAIALDTCVNARKAQGGPAPESVAEQINEIKKFRGRESAQKFNLKKQYNPCE